MDEPLDDVLIIDGGYLLYQLAPASSGSLKLSENNFLEFLHEIEHQAGVKFSKRYYYEGTMHKQQSKWHHYIRNIPDFFYVKILAMKQKHGHFIEKGVDVQVSDGMCTLYISLAIYLSITCPFTRLTISYIFIVTDCYKDAGVSPWFHSIFFLFSHTHSHTLYIIVINRL